VAPSALIPVSPWIVLSFQSETFSSANPSYQQKFLPPDPFLRSARIPSDDDAELSMDTEAIIKKDCTLRGDLLGVLSSTFFDSRSYGALLFALLPPSCLLRRAFLLATR